MLPSLLHHQLMLLLLYIKGQTKIKKKISIIFLQKPKYYLNDNFISMTLYKV